LKKKLAQASTPVPIKEEPKMQVPLLRLQCGKFISNCIWEGGADVSSQVLTVTTGVRPPQHLYNYC
jgi:hypothetical protein